MKIDLDRLCRLAGLNKSAKSLNEASNRSYHEDPALDAERKVQHANQLNETEDSIEEEPLEYNEAMDDHDDENQDEMAGHGTGSMEENLDEVIEIDEAMLVQELRRAKAMISEAKSEAKSNDEPEELSEAQLRKFVADEVAAAMKDFNLTSGWVYGDNKPTTSKRGQVVTSMPGIGFKKI